MTPSTIPPAMNGARQQRNSIIISYTGLYWISQEDASHHKSVLRLLLHTTYILLEAEHSLLVAIFIPIQHFLCTHLRCLWWMTNLLLPERAWLCRNAACAPILWYGVTMDWWTPRCLAYFVSASLSVYGTGALNSTISRWITRSYFRVELNQ